MKRITSVFKSCDIRNVLYHLTVGLSQKEYAEMLERYYSLYCMIVESWVPNETCEVVITSFRQVGYDLEKPIYGFFGIRDYFHAQIMLDEQLNWREVIEGKVEVLIPNYLLEVVDEDLLIAEVLCQLDKVAPTAIPKRCNKKLFGSVRELDDGKKRKLYAVEKVLEQKLCYQLDRRRVENTLLEYSERSSGMTVKWGDILGKEGDPFIEHLIKHPRGREVLERKIRMGGLPPLYKWFIKLDLENTPDLRRCQSKKSDLLEKYECIELSDYQEIMDEHMRIIIEQNSSLKELPLVYIRNKYGERMELSKVGLSKLLCMDIYVTDKRITDPYHVLALIIFYMEYPLRVERIQKEYMIMALLEMKITYEYENSHDKMIADIKYEKQ